MAEDAWDLVAGGWRAAAAAEGFRTLERGETGAEGEKSVVEFLFDGESTYLDLTGELRAGKKAQVTGAAIHTWVDLDGKRVDVASIALSRRGPGSYNPVALFSHYLLRPVLTRLLPAPLRPVRLSGPADLAVLIGQHRTLLEREGGTKVRAEGDPLQARFAMAQQGEEPAP